MQGVVLILQISIGIAAFTYRDAMKESFKKGLTNSMKSYKVPANKEAVDSLQNTVFIFATI